MLVTTKIKLDLQRPSYPVVVNAVQGEQNTRQLELSLYSGSVAWMVPDNVSVAMRYCKPDKTKGYYDTMPDGSASFTVSENRVSARLAPQMLTVPGTVVAQIVLHQGTQTLATFSIHIRVEADPSAGAATSEDYVNRAQWIQSELDAYLEQLKTNGEFLGGTFVGDVNMNGHALSGLRVPVAPDDAATKEYVDENATGAVSTVSGVAPDASGNVPLNASHVKALSIGGGIMEGPINMNGQKVTGLNAPTEDSEAANKGYVDQHTNPPLPGVIYPYSGANIPDGFLLCDGAAYSRTEYAELFAAIGTMYGSGDGSTTFNVPDLVERVPAGAGDNHAVGEMVGEETHTLTVNEMPSHRHQVRRSQGSNASGANALQTAVKVDTIEDAAYGTFATGGSQPHNNMQPTTYIRGYIIATGKGSCVSVQDIIAGAQALPLGIEYGGIGATNAADARMNLEITPENIGALSMELLWENASITSQFSRDQTVAFEQEYDLFIITVIASTIFGRRTNCLVVPNISINTLEGNTGAGSFTSRDVIAEKNKIWFDAGISNTAGNITGGDDNCIPFRIYGMKGVSE